MDGKLGRGSKLNEPDMLLLSAALIYPESMDQLLAPLHHTHTRLLFVFHSFEFHITLLFYADRIRPELIVSNRSL